MQAIQSAGNVQRIREEVEGKAGKGRVVMPVIDHSCPPWKHIVFSGTAKKETEWILDSEGNFLADIITTDDAGKCERDPRKRLANARLIAAAPRLLAAIKRMLVVKGDKDWYESIEGDAREEAEDAIEQAEKGA